MYHEQYLKALIERDEDGVYIASVPALPGCRSQAKTYEQAVKRVKQAADLYLEVMKDKQQLETIVGRKQPSFFAVEDLALAI